MIKFEHLVFNKIWPVSLKLGLILGGIGFVFGLILGGIQVDSFVASDLLHCLKVGSLFGLVILFCPILVSGALSILYALVFIFSEAFKPLMRWTFREFLRK